MWGLAPTDVRVVPYCEYWPAIFKLEKARLLAALPEITPAIEHIGSTAVANLAAKPIIDIMLGLMPCDVTLMEVVQMLESAGYEWHGEKGVLGRNFFTRGEPRVFHLHLVEQHGPIWNNHLLFRTSLCVNPLLAADYATLKAELAARFPDDRESYTQGKSMFIEQALELTRSST